MFWKLLLVGVVIVAVMVAIKDGRVLRATGLTGSCTVVSTAPNGIQVKACKKGKIHGAPNLAVKGCTQTGILDGRTYWRCPPRS
jgi:hypothetical protein